MKEKLFNAFIFGDHLGREESCIWMLDNGPGAENRASIDPVID